MLRAGRLVLVSLLVLLAIYVAVKFALWVYWPRQDDMP